jgi:hypothetical protein
MQHPLYMGALSVRQFSRLLQILAPYRNEALTPAILALAARCARQEVPA